MTRCPNTTRPWPPTRTRRARPATRRTPPRGPRPRPTAGGRGCATPWPRSPSSPPPPRWSAGTPSTSWSARPGTSRRSPRWKPGIPDTGALIFAALGIALALHGRRALRPRTLNVACVGLSLTMNAIAAGPGWRDMAIWVMPAAVYALASDTLIGVVRAWALARMHASGQVLDGEEATPLAVAGAVLLWLLRLALAPASTLGGFRRWMVEECPVAPGRKAPAPQPAPPGRPAPPAELPRSRCAAAADGRPRKQDLLIALASQRHDLRRLPLNRVARIAGEIGAEVDLHQGTARRVLRAHVLTLQHAPHPAHRTEARP